MPQQPDVERVVLAFVVDVLADLTSDLDVGAISAPTRIADLGVESIALVYLVAEIQQHFDLQDGVFQLLRQEQRTLTELQVGGLVELVCELLATCERLQETAR